MSLNAWAANGALSDYNTNISYDANGNITALERKGYGATLGMDDFTYHYGAGNNQLKYVDDNGGYTSNYGVDIDDQSPGNYGYNGIGQLERDDSESALYDWNVYGKVRSVGRFGSGSESALGFGYDPQGNRVYKAVKPRSSGALTAQDEWTESWYIRDVRGNIMAVYGSSYEVLEANPGSVACGFVVIGNAGPDASADSVDIVLDSIGLLDVPVAWAGSAAATACGVAVALSGYGSDFSASCSKDTVYICSVRMTDEFNGLAFDTTGRHSKIIPMTLGTMTGGLNDSTVYRMTLQQDEHHIYGSSRLGVSKHDAGLSRAEFIAAPQPSTLNGSNILDVFADYFQTAGTFGVVTLTAAPTHTVSLDVEKDFGFAVIGTSDTLDGYLILGKVGNKTYEYSNHLGNVLLTTSDRHLAQDGNGDDLVDYFAADVLSYSDYYPYGMAMVGRSNNLSSYRFGYQGSEMDNSHKGNGNSYSTYFRQLDPRLGRWMSIDPVVQPWQSPYTSMDCNPIIWNDQRGNKVTKTPSGTTKSILGGRISIFKNNEGKKFLNIGSLTIPLPKGMKGGRGKLGGSLSKLKKTVSTLQSITGGSNPIKVVVTVQKASDEKDQKALTDIAPQVKEDFENSLNENLGSSENFKSLNNELRDSGNKTFESEATEDEPNRYFKYSEFTSRRQVGEDDIGTTKNDATGNPVSSEVIERNLPPKKVVTPFTPPYYAPQWEEIQSTQPVIKKVGILNVKVYNRDGTTSIFIIKIDEVPPIF